MHTQKHHQNSYDKENCDSGVFDLFYSSENVSYMNSTRQDRVFHPDEDTILNIGDRSRCRKFDLNTQEDPFRNISLSIKRATSENLDPKRQNYLKEFKDFEPSPSLPNLRQRQRVQVTKDEASERNQNNAPDYGLNQQINQNLESFFQQYHTLPVIHRTKKTTDYRQSLKDNLNDFWKHFKSNTMEQEVEASDEEKSLRKKRNEKSHYRNVLERSLQNPWKQSEEDATHLRLPSNRKTYDRNSKADIEDFWNSLDVGNTEQTTLNSTEDMKAPLSNTINGEAEGHVVTSDASLNSEQNSYATSLNDHHYNSLPIRRKKNTFYRHSLKDDLDDVWKHLESDQKKQEHEESDDEKSLEGRKENKHDRNENQTNDAQIHDLTESSTKIYSNDHAEEQRHYNTLPVRRKKKNADYRHSLKDNLNDFWKQFESENRNEDRNENGDDSSTIVAKEEYFNVQIASGQKTFWESMKIENEDFKREEEEIGNTNGLRRIRSIVPQDSEEDDFWRTFESSTDITDTQSNYESDESYTESYKSFDTSLSSCDTLQDESEDSFHEEFSNDGPELSSVLEVATDVKALLDQSNTSIRRRRTLRRESSEDMNVNFWASLENVQATKDEFSNEENSKEIHSGEPSTASQHHSHGDVILRKSLKIEMEEESKETEKLFPSTRSVRKLKRRSVKIRDNSDEDFDWSQFENTSSNRMQEDDNKRDTLIIPDSVIKQERRNSRLFINGQEFDIGSEGYKNESSVIANADFSPATTLVKISSVDKNRNVKTKNIKRTKSLLDFSFEDSGDEDIETNSRTQFFKSRDFHSGRVGEQNETCQKVDILEVAPPVSLMRSRSITVASVKWTNSKNSRDQLEIGNMENVQSMSSNETVIQSTKTELKLKQSVLESSQNVNEEPIKIRHKGVKNSKKRLRRNHRNTPKADDLSEMLDSGNLFKRNKQPSNNLKSVTNNSHCQENENCEDDKPVTSSCKLEENKTWSTESESELVSSTALVTSEKERSTSDTHKPEIVKIAQIIMQRVGSVCNTDDLKAMVSKSRNKLNLTKPEEDTSEEDKIQKGIGREECSDENTSKEKRIRKLFSFFVNGKIDSFGKIMTNSKLIPSQKSYENKCAAEKTEEKYEINNNHVSCQFEQENIRNDIRMLNNSNIISGVSEFQNKTRQHEEIEILKEKNQMSETTCGHNSNKSRPDSDERNKDDEDDHKHILIEEKTESERKARQSSAVLEGTEFSAHFNLQQSQEEDSDLTSENEELTEIDDCALQLSHNAAYLDLEGTIEEQEDILEGFRESRKNTIILRTQLSVRVHNIIAKLLTATGRDLRRALFSLKQIFQDDKDLVHEFVTNDGLSCLITVGTDADQNYQNYILRAIGQIMLYVDGMNGVIDHNDTIQWLYSLLSSKYRLVQKTSLKLLLVFVEYTETNSLLVWRAAQSHDKDIGHTPMKAIIDIISETDGNTDEDLLVYAMTLVNKVLCAIPDQDLFYDVVDSLEEQAMEEIIQRLNKRSPRNSDLVEQCNIYELSIKSEDGDNYDSNTLKVGGIRQNRTSTKDMEGERRKSRRHSSIKSSSTSDLLKSPLTQSGSDLSKSKDTLNDEEAKERRRQLRKERRNRTNQDVVQESQEGDEDDNLRKVKTHMGHIDKEMPSRPVHIMQNGHVAGKKTETAEYIVPNKNNTNTQPKSPRLKMKETFDLEEGEQNGRMSLRERLAQRQKQKSGERASPEESPLSSTSSITSTQQKAPSQDDEKVVAKQSIGEAGGENRRMRLRMMYGSSVDKTDQELSEDMKKMDLGAAISDRKATSEKEKIVEETADNKSSTDSTNLKADKVKKDKEEKEKKEEKSGFLSKVKSAIGVAKPPEPPSATSNKSNQRTAEDIELESRVLRSRPLVINEYDFRDLNEEDDIDTIGPVPKALPMSKGGVPPPPPPPPGFGAPPPPPGMGPPPPPPMPGLPPPPPGPPMPGGTLKSRDRKYVRLFWQEVKTITLTQGIDKTIWGKLDNVDLDTKKLEHLFENRVKASMKRSDSVSDFTKKKEISVLDLKRAQAINIVLTKLPPVRVIKQAILDMDGAVIDKEGVEKIMSMVPTDEEKTKLQEAQMQFPDTPFAHAESFLLTLSSITELSARLSLWSFKMEYDIHEKEIGEGLSDLKVACTEIRKSDTFKKCLSLLLAIGNFLNGVNIKGFNLNYLEKVPEVKDTVHKQTLLFHLCNMILEKFPDTTDLYSEFGAVNRSSRCDFENISSLLRKVDDQCKKSWEHLRLVAKHDSSSPLKQKLTDFLGDAGERIAILKVIHRRVTNRFTKLLMYLGMSYRNAKDTKPLEFCKIISEFALEYRTIRQRVLETKKRKENMKKRTKTRGKLITESENFSGATTAVPLGNPDQEDGMDALNKALAGNNLTPTKNRTRAKKTNNNLDINKLNAPAVSGNLSNYDTDDQTDQMMDMLVKSATNDKKSRIRKNRTKTDSKSTRKSARRTRTLKSGLSPEELEMLQQQANNL